MSKPISQTDAPRLAALVTGDARAALDDVLRRFWLAPHEMEPELRAALPAGLADLRIRISGETSNVTMYADDGTNLLAYMPFASLDRNPVLQDGPAETWTLVELDERLRKRLDLPRVLLINPCVLENFPVPRLSLSIGLLSAWLRKAQKADARLIDMQMGTTIDEIVDEIVRFAPHAIGLSISYGQKHVALSIVDRIYDLKQRGLLDAMVVLGNVVPASFPDEFLRRYPGLVIATGEGETTVEALCDVLMGTRDLSSVPALAFVSDGRMASTPKQPVYLPDMPLPSLDTMTDLARFRGAVTLELSRGCQWNVCTFCPREHKSAVWKTYTAEQMVEQFGQLEEACGVYGVTKHVFLADEEFVGGIDDGAETERLIKVARSLIARGSTMKFDAAARVDQVFSMKMDGPWHVHRLEMWDLSRQAGLDRLFMGIESGSDSQLRRYGKGIRAEHTVKAIRLLSALDIHLRFGFITFDQLMVGMHELKENVAFLERTDAFVEVEPGRYSYRELFELLTKDDDFAREHSVGKPIFAGVSYMLASMEVLISSMYAKLLAKKDPNLVLDLQNPDTNMGRYRVGFVDPVVRDISTCCQEWIDRHFGVAYTVKSLFKIAPEDQRAHLMTWMIAFRTVSLSLLKALIHIFDDEHDGVEFLYKRALRVTPAAAAEVDSMRRERLRLHPDDRVDLIHRCLDLFDDLVGTDCAQLLRLLESGEIDDTVDRRLKRLLDRWYERKGEWSLINDPELPLAGQEF